MRVETLALESNIGGMEAAEGDKRSAGDAFRKRALGEKIGAYGSVRVSLVSAKVEEALRRSRDGVTVSKVGSFHGGELALGAVLLSV